MSVATNVGTATMSPMETSPSADDDSVLVVPHGSSGDGHMETLMEAAAAHTAPSSRPNTITSVPAENQRSPLSTSSTFAASLMGQLGALDSQHVLGFTVPPSSFMMQSEA
ncbi:hypothetical protein ZWY2020_005121 [Hordeum vulgare]|nr:hypothetical protein ZWY2020_005121 [Hordeum vulgare]